MSITENYNNKFTKIPLVKKEAQIKQWTRFKKPFKVF